MASLIGRLIPSVLLLIAYVFYKYVHHNLVDSVTSITDLKNGSFTYDFDFENWIRSKNMMKYPYPYKSIGIDRRQNLSLQEFADIYDGKWPVIITDIVPQWPAFNWNVEQLSQQYGQEKVVMKTVKNGLGQATSLSVTLKEFLAKRQDVTSENWHYIEDELFISLRPELKSSITVNPFLEEDYFRLFPPDVRPWNSMMLWGTAFSRSPLHVDPYNWTGTNAVLFGRKRWKLFPPGNDGLLSISTQKCGFPLECVKYNSPIDAFSTDHTKYPAYPEAKRVEFDQHPGELLIIPTGWLHQAFNVEETLAISSQVMNSQNYLVVLEEIIKGGSVQRQQLPDNVGHMTPPEQVQLFLDLLPNDVLVHGKLVTERMVAQINKVS